MAKSKILIVEDEYIIAENMQTIIEGWGYTVVGIESTGLKAIEKIKETEPDLILMDIKIKGEMDGIETANTIKKLFSIPLIYLTSYSDTKILERAQLTEPYGYLIKPYNERELKATIKMAIYKNSIDKKLASVKTMLLTVFNSIGVGIIITDNAGLVKLLNPTALKILGLKKEQSIGKEIGEVFPIHLRDKGTEETPSSNTPFFTAGFVPKKIITLGVNNDAVLNTTDNKQINIYGSISPVKSNKAIIGAVFAFQKSNLNTQQIEATNIASGLLRSGITSGQID
ncbi:MAG: response regulator [Nitrospirae bacterium]|nr:response regulator [Nitrospirota bacterium]